MTGQRAQTRFAASSRESRAAVGSLEGAKNRPASSRRHTASVCQGASWSLSRAGTRWAGVVKNPDHPVAGLFAAIQDKVEGVSCGCADVFGARDAAIHAVQACVPQMTLLPVGVERITGSLNGQTDALFVRAEEKERLANGFVYDVELTDAEGQVRERWERLYLRAVSGTDFNGPWPEGLLTPYVERCLLELVPDASVSVTFETDPSSNRRDRSTRAIESALGSVGVIHRADGRPTARDGRDVSASHCGDLTMAIAGNATVACDLELVARRSPEIWSDMLGVERFKLAEVISRETHETTDMAATRVWTAIECLKKAGGGMTPPLVFVSAAPNGWLLLASGELKIV